jgi:hypothetical protein
MGVIEKTVCPCVRIIATTETNVKELRINEQKTADVKDPKIALLLFLIKTKAKIAAVKINNS